MSDGARVVAGVLCLVVLASTAAPVWGQSAPRAGIGEVSVSGGGVVSPTETGNGSTYLWQDESANVSVAFTDYPNARNYRVCLGYERADAPIREVDCRLKALPAGANGTAQFTNVTWPANATGEQGLAVELQKLSNESNVTVLDRKTVPVTVLRERGDFDGDGLTNQQEVTKGFNVSNPDMDADGLDDGAEVNQYGSNPQDPDTDGDGIRDGIEIQRGTSPTAVDTDGDGLNDRLEVTLGTDPTNDITPLWLGLVALLVIGVLAAVFVAARRGWRERFGESTATPDGDDESGPAATSQRNDSDPDSTPEVTTDPTPEPLTDEDRVLALLRDHGGRMKQSRIVEETEWSKAKVSRLLSSMNDDGAVDKLSIGRENIISLDGHGPEAARSPHEENASD